MTIPIAAAQIGTQSVSNIFTIIFGEIQERNRRQHIEKMKDLEIIKNSVYADDYARLLIVERIIRPFDQTQKRIQDAAKHAQWLSQAIVNDKNDHGLSEENALEMAEQLKMVAIKITNIESINDLKVVYEAITHFSMKILSFRHVNNQNLSMETSIREKILNVLNECIAESNNFKLQCEVFGHVGQMAIAREVK